MNNRRSVSYIGAILLSITACSPTAKVFDNQQNLDKSYNDESANPVVNKEAVAPANETIANNQTPQNDTVDANTTNDIAGENVADNAEKEVKLPPNTYKAVTDEEFIHAAALKEGEEQMAIICARNQNKQNIVVQKFCVENLRPKSITELQDALGLRIPPNSTRRMNGRNGVPGYALQGHSSSLVGQFVSAINPRAILFNSQDPENDENGIETNNFVAMGFVRGEQFAEIIVGNKDSDPMTFSADEDPNFFLVAFKQACNAKPEGCNAGELLTPAVESDWTSFTIYQAEDLKNTIVDCLHCHQPDKNGPRFARMQELRGPWNHFMRDNNDNGNALLDDYFAAHGTEETYAGIPASSISGSNPAKLEDFIRSQNFNMLQVPEIEYNSRNILRQITDNDDAQPMDNTLPGVSAEWEALYQQSLTGVAGDNNSPIIPIPYHDTKVTEPALLDKFTKQYQDFLAGNVTMDQFEDHRRIFRTEQKQLADMGFAVREETPPEVMLVQACGQCHQSKLDDSISRARFRVKLEDMGANAKLEIDVAIQRLKLGYTPERLKQEGISFVSEDGLQPVELEKGEHIRTMPPRRFKSLTDAQIDSLIAYLKAEQAKLP